MVECLSEKRGLEGNRLVQMSLKLRRSLARYFLSLQLSAAAALPTFEQADVVFPAPVVRQLPGLLQGRWDEREIVRANGADWIVTRSLPRSTPEFSIDWN